MNRLHEWLGVAALIGHALINLPRLIYELQNETEVCLYDDEP